MTRYSPTAGAVKVMVLDWPASTTRESHVWGSFVAEGEPTEDVTVVNRIIAKAVIAALKLGDIKFAGADFAYIDHLLISQRPTH